MRFQVVIVDLEMSMKAKRRAAFGAAAAAVLGVAAVAYAGVPHKFNAGDTISASKLNENFEQVAPTGAIMAWAVPDVSPPPGWLFCDGSALDKNKYPELFNKIATAYGGNGAPMFNLPDLRGRVIVAPNVMGAQPSAGRVVGKVNGQAYTGAVAADAVGVAGGNEGHILTVDELAPHTHPGTFASANHKHGSGNMTTEIGLTASGILVNWVANAGWTFNSRWNNTGGWGGVGESGGQNGGAVVMGTTDPPSGTDTVGSTGKGTPEGTMPPFLVVNYIIKY